VYIVERAQREGVTHELPEVLEVMHSSVRLGHGDAAVMLFDQMLNKGTVPGANLIHKALSNNFFKLVVDTLDDKRI